MCLVTVCFVPFYRNQHFSVVFVRFCAFSRIPGAPAPKPGGAPAAIKDRVLIESSAVTSHHRTVPPLCVPLCRVGPALLLATQRRRAGRVAHDAALAQPANAAGVQAASPPPLALISEAPFWLPR